MDEEPRVSRSVWAWIALGAFWLALGLFACLGGCSSAVSQLRADCVGSGGEFVTRRGTVTVGDMTYPAVMFLCVFNGKTA